MLLPVAGVAPANPSFIFHGQKIESFLCWLELQWATESFILAANYVGTSSGGDLSRAEIAEQFFSETLPLLQQSCVRFFAKCVVGVKPIVLLVFVASLSLRERTFFWKYFLWSWRDHRRVYERLIAERRLPAIQPSVLFCAAHIPIADLLSPRPNVGFETISKIERVINFALSWPTAE